MRGVILFCSAVLLKAERFYITSSKGAKKSSDTQEDEGIKDRTRIQKYRGQMWPGGEYYCLRDRRRELRKGEMCKHMKLILCSQSSTVILR